MGLCIVLEDEAGEAVDTPVADEKNLLHRLLPPHNDSSNPMLASIDWYGDTVFNGAQMKRFLTEWESLAARIHTSEEQSLVAQVKELALRCQNGVHLYVKFIGD